MRVVVFGATGMVGQGVVLECLEDAGVTEVLAVVRKPAGVTHAKLRELLHKDFTNFSALEGALAGVDACFFCLGVSSAGMSEADYTRVTYDIAVAAAQTLQKVSPGATFCFVSGAGTDGTEKGSSMWARVKGKAENAVLALYGERGFVFRPGYIHPMKGVVSGTRLYRAFYVVLGPLYPLLKAAFPRMVTTTVAIGRAMLNAVRVPPAVHVLEVKDINALAAAP